MRGREPSLWREIPLSSTSKVRSKRRAAAPLGPVTRGLIAAAAGAGAEPVSAGYKISQPGVRFAGAGAGGGASRPCELVVRLMTFCLWPTGFERRERGCKYDGGGHQICRIFDHPPRWRISCRTIGRAVPSCVERGLIPTDRWPMPPMFFVNPRQQYNFLRRTQPARWPGAGWGLYTKIGSVLRTTAGWT